MSTGQKIRCYEYINQPYDIVRKAIKADPAKLFQSATKAAASRASTIAAGLHIDLAGVTISTDIAIVVKEVTEKPGEFGAAPSTHMLLEWEAMKAPHLFPLMKADLSIYPLTSTETQLDFSGSYVPPLGALGTAINAVVGHRIADGSVHRFVKEVAEFLRANLKQK